MICIISSATENLNLVKLCQQLSISYTLVVDSLFWPYQDKTPEFLIQRTQEIMEYMTSQGATHFLLSPTIELNLLEKKGLGILNSEFGIIPLFTNYLTHCLQHSLVGKIGFVGGYSDISQIESLFGDISEGYQATDSQKNTKKFQQPLSKWTKDVSMREYFSRLYSPRSLLINKTIKEDLRYFKDANVDTLIPLNYSYFNHQRIITSYLNQKQHKFHKRDTVNNIFKETIKKDTFGIVHSELCIVHYTGSSHLITNKKWEALLSQGGQHTITYQPINL